MEEVPREAFVEAGDRGHAYRDSALGIACGQTISQPFVVAYMTEQLQLQKDHRVLEIGTGSGYQAAVCRGCAGSAHDRALPDAGRQRPERLEKLGYDNIEVMLGDGYDIPPAPATSTASSSRRRWTNPRQAAGAAGAGRHPDRAGRAASGHPDPGPRRQDRERLRPQGAGRRALRAGAAGDCPRAVESRIGGSRQRLIRKG